MLKDARSVFCYQNTLHLLVNDLQVTRIGRTVSDLRKIDGEVGVAAKALIAKWKSMVVAETISSSESDDDDDDGNNGKFELIFCLQLRDQLVVFSFHCRQQR